MEMRILQSVSWKKQQAQTPYGPAYRTCNVRYKAGYKDTHITIKCYTHLFLK